MALNILDTNGATITKTGAEWLHVDFEPHLTGFYRSCGFRLTKAGLIKLA